VEVRHINIQAEGGRVILRGAVGSAMEKGNCEKSVAGIEGVREVDNQLFVTEHFRSEGDSRFKPASQKISSPGMRKGSCPIQGKVLINL